MRFEAGPRGDRRTPPERTSGGLDSRSRVSASSDVKAKLGHAGHKKAADTTINHEDPLTELNIKVQKTLLNYQTSAHAHQLHISWVVAMADIKSYEQGLSQLVKIGEWFIRRVTEGIRSEVPERAERLRSSIPECESILEDLTVIIANGSERLKSSVTVPWKKGALTRIITPTS